MTKIYLRVCDYTLKISMDCQNFVISKSHLYQFSFLIIVQWSANRPESYYKRDKSCKETLLSVFLKS